MGTLADTLGNAVLGEDLPVADDDDDCTIPPDERLLAAFSDLSGGGDVIGMLVDSRGRLFVLALIDRILDFNPAVVAALGLKGGLEGSLVGRAAFGLGVERDRGIEVGLGLAVSR